MAGVSKTNSFGTFLETIEKRSAPADEPAAAPAGEPPAGSGMTDVARRVLHVLAKGPASVTELREQAGLDPSDTVLSDLTLNGFVEKATGRPVRYMLTAQGRAVVELLSA
jgi:DNA-binding MarR family transcriptional regulator